MSRSFKIPAVEKIQFNINSWSGINKVSGCENAGEFKEALNMGGHRLPFASPSLPKKVVAQNLVNPSYLFFADNKMGYIANGILYHGKKTEGSTEEADSNGYVKIGDFGTPKTVVDINNYLVGFPNNVFYDYSQIKELDEIIGDINKASAKVNKTSYNANMGYLTYKRITYRYTEINDYFDMPIETTEGVDTKYLTPSFIPEGSSFNITYFVDFYNSSYEKLNSEICTLENNDYFGEDIDPEIEIEDKAKYFKIRISAYEDYIGSISAQQRFYNAVTATNPSIVLYVYNKTYPIAGSVPEISHACVDSNRVIGVFKSNIYASSLGNFRDFTTFADVEGEPNPVGAYATVVDSPGDFTGAVFYNNYTVLFKENYTYIMYGNKPPYRINCICEKGCIDGRSVIEINNILYFASSDGIYAFTGGTPKCISEKLGEIEINEAVSGTDGENLFIGMNNKLYVYYTKKNIWLAEDNISPICFATYKNNIYALTNNGKVLLLNSSENERISWYFKTPEYSFLYPETKNIRRLYIRANIPVETKCEVKISLNGGEYFKIGTIFGKGESIYDLRIRSGKCDNFSLMLSGTGDLTLKDIHIVAVKGIAKH